MTELTWQLERTFVSQQALPRTTHDNCTCAIDAVSTVDDLESGKSHEFFGTASDSELQSRSLIFQKLRCRPILWIQKCLAVDLF